MALEGELVILREERSEDMQPLVDLRNDLETQAWSKTLPPDYTVSMYLKRFEGREFSFDRKDGRFIIESKNKHEFAGTISYTGLQPRWSTFIGIMLAKKFWGGGFAFDAQEVMLKFLFEELGLQREPVTRRTTASVERWVWPRNLGLRFRCGSGKPFSKAVRFTTI